MTAARSFEDSIDRRALLRGAAGLTAMLGVAAIVDFGAASRASAYSWTRTLQQGASGADVAELQIRVGGWAASSA